MRAPCECDEKGVREEDALDVIENGIFDYYTEAAGSEEAT
jgi:hypothetical protein